MLISVPTASRRTTAAISQLANVLREMGAGDDVDDLILAEHFGDPSGLSSQVTGGAEEETLRFAADWRAPMVSSVLAPSMTRMGDEPVPTLPGWSRPVRVGVFVSYKSWSTVGWRGIRQTMESQVQSTPLLVHPGLHAVGVIEPGTGQRGLIESTLREYELTAGLIDATDVEELGDAGRPALRAELRAARRRRACVSRSGAQRRRRAAERALEWHGRRVLR
jgi:uncharacterized membrane protein